MRLGPKQKKWARRLLIFILIWFVVINILIYTIEYRFENIVQVYVKKESKGLYAFDAADLHISLLHKTITVKEAFLYCKDSLHVKTNYNVHIPRISLAIQSWRELVFNKTLSVDSLGISSPQIKITEHTAHVKRQNKFHPSQIFNALHKVLVHLQVHSFSLQDGTLVFHHYGSKKPLICKGANISLKNFLKDDNYAHRLLSSDDINISLPRQDWSLPDGLHQVSFSGLQFSGKSQYFQLDSIFFSATDPANRNTMSLTAEKLFFNSKELASTYETQQLVIDTLLCFHPVLNLQTPDKKKAKDSISVTKSITHLFKAVNLKYIDVRDGQIVMNDQNTNFPTYITEHTDLRVFNFSLPAKNASAFSVDSVQLNLNKIQFVTADSMFQITAKQFSLRNNDLLLKDVIYGPTHLNHHHSHLQFTAKTLHLKDISLDNLLRKKITGSQAELYNPEITIYAGGPTAKANDTMHNIAHFYRSLHNLHNLITVNNFNIINGNMQYNNSGNHPVHMQMKNLNAEILLEHFFRSNALYEVKRSIPKLNVGEIIIQSPKQNITVNNYQFDGLRRHNRANHLKIALHNKTTITAEKLYWEIFVWDLYQREKKIRMDYLRTQKLTIQADGENTGNNKNNHKLPDINIGRIDIDQLYFTKSSPEKNSIHFEAKNICTDAIASEGNFLKWQNAMGLFEHISFGSKHSDVSIKRINVNNQYETVAEEIDLTANNNNGSTNVQIPIIKISGKLQSTDLSTLHTDDFIINDASVFMYKKKAQPDSNKSFSVPLNFLANNFALNNLSVKYITEKEKDTITTETTIDLKAAALRLTKNAEKIMEFDKASVNINNLKHKKNRLVLTAPQSAITLENGSVIKSNEQVSFNAAVFAGWNQAALNLYKKDTTSLAIENFSGGFSDPSFLISNSTKLQWQELINKTTVTNSRLNFTGKTSSIQADSILWHPGINNLSIRNFSVLPNKSMEETFGKNKWQSDYITIQGDKLDIDGIKFNPLADSLIAVNKICLYKADITTTRDKRMPAKPGAEKFMPTKLINSVHFPLKIDTLVLQQSNITVHEISPTTQKKGTIPLQNINVSIVNISNRTNDSDSLKLHANLRLFDKHINFHYQESYADSLSSFKAVYTATPAHLSPFSHITVPLAAVSVDRGRSDTVFAHLHGNKYAAIGEMNFYYKGLKVRLLDPLDTSNKKFLLSLENMVANTFILNKRNSSNSVMYFERSREKFVFHYWIKTTLSGILSATHIKSSKKYLKEYGKKQAVYSLPDYHR